MCYTNSVTFGKLSPGDASGGEAVALDTNVCIFALRKEPTYPAGELLLFDKLNELQVHMPLQIIVELQRNLMASEMRGLYAHSVARRNGIMPGTASSGNGSDMGEKGDA